jgi:hypothetical protein
MRGSSTGVVGGVASALSLSLAIAGAAQAQSTPKELFIGLDGSTTQLAAASKSPGPAKPLKPKVLGLQTTIFQLFDDGGTRAVSPSTVFSAGNRIRLGFNANKEGFLYVANLGSSGKVTTIFPSSVTDNNQVQPGLVYQVPQQTGKSIKFDSTPGAEMLLVVLSESRISSFEYGGQMIALMDPKGAGPLNAESAQQRVALASLDTVAVAKDLFVEDDGVFQTVVFKPGSEPTPKKKPLVTAIKLIHR